MSFAIEVPGEANPLTEETLLRVLQAAASSDPQQIQSGAKQLQEWEKAAGYYKHLQSVYIDRSLPHVVRYLAIIQLKHGVDKYWRKTATKCVHQFRVIVCSYFADTLQARSTKRTKLSFVLG